MDTHVDVDGPVVAGGQERLPRERLKMRPREVLVDLAAVDVELAASRADDDPRNRDLPLARRLDDPLGGKLDPRPVADDRLLLALGGRLGLGPRPLLRLGLAPGALLRAELALGLERDGIELGARG